MALNPFVLSAIGGLISGFASRKPRYDPAQKIQMDVARSELAYGRGIPGSDPQERALLAQQRGLLGQEQEQGLGMLLGSLPANATTNTTDMLRNIGGSFATERAGLDQQALMEWFNKRRQAMLNASQIAQGVGAPRDVRQNQLPQMFGQLASLYAQQQALKQGGGGAGVMGQGAGRQGPAPMGTQASGPLSAAAGGTLFGIPVGQAPSAQAAPWTMPAGGQMADMTPDTKYAPL